MKQYEDLMKQFHELEERFLADIQTEHSFVSNGIKTNPELSLLCEDFDSIQPESLRSFFLSEYDNWDRRQQDLLEQEELEIGERARDEWETYDRMVPERIYANAERYYEDGWNLDEEALHKFVFNEIKKEETEKRKEYDKEYAEFYAGEPEYEPFTFQEWSVGLSILEALNTAVPEGTIDLQLEWLHLALMYNRFFGFFDKEKYKRGIDYELKLQERLRLGELNEFREALLSN
jgi:hypothetical protein